MGDNPEKFVEAALSGPWVATLQHNELLSEREIFRNKTPMAVKDPNERSEPEKEQIEHGPELYENHGRMMQQVADSTSGQSLGEGQYNGREPEVQIGIPARGTCAQPVT